MSFGILATCLLVSLASCLESEEQPKLDPKDLVRLRAFTGLYQYGEKNKDGSIEEKYVLIQDQGNNRYTVRRRSADPTGEETVFETACISLAIASSGERFLCILSEKGKQTKKPRYLDLISNQGAWRYDLLAIDPDSPNMPRANQALAKRGLSLKDSGFSKSIKGPLTSQVLRELFSDPEFRSAFKPESMVSLQPLSSDKRQLVSKLFDQGRENPPPSDLDDGNAKQALKRPDAQLKPVGSETAQQWSERYKNPKQISNHEFLKQLRSVKLEFSASPELLHHVSYDAMQRKVIQSVEREGLQIDGRSPITLRVTWNLHVTRVVRTLTTTDRYGQSESNQEHPVLLHNQNLMFLVTSPVYRKGKFYNLKMIAMGDFDFNSTVCGELVIKEHVQEVVVSELAKGIGKLMKRIRSDTSTLFVPVQPRWTADESDRMYADFLIAKTSAGDDLERVFAAVTDISKLTFEPIDLTEKYLSQGDGRRMWLSYLPESKLNLASNGQLHIKHVLYTQRMNASHLDIIFGDIADIPFAVCFSVIYVVDTDAVFELNGQFVSTAVLKVDVRQVGDLWREREETVKSVARDHIRDFLREARYLR